MEKNKTIPGTDTSSLHSLVDFLNFEFDSDDVDELERLKQKYEPRTDTFEGKLLAPARLWQWKYGTKAAREADRLQKKIRGILIPIISPARADNATKAYHRIQRLFKEINKFEFQTKWDVRAILYHWEESEFADFELFKGKPQDDPPRSVISPQRELNIMGYRWLFGRDFSLLDGTGFSEEMLYLVILYTLESGEFPKLKRCQWEDCQTFFVADPPRRKTCNNDHAREVDRIEAGKRVIEGRREKREEKRRRSWPAKELKGILVLLEFLKQTKKGEWDKRRLREGLATAFREWQNDGSLNEIWRELPDELQELFIREAKKQEPLSRSRKAP